MVIGIVQSNDGLGLHIVNGYKRQTIPLYD